MEKVIRQLSAWLPVLLWSLLIFKFSAGSVPVASTVYWQDFAVKKTGHIMLFGMMALLIYRGFRINNIPKVKSAIYSVLLAFFYGGTDELGHKAVMNRVSVNDLHATILHLLGINHEKLTYFFNGRNFRLTDVAGNVVREIIA